MPCTDGGAPVTIDRLLGFVNDGMTQSPTSDVLPARSDASHGIAPASTARSRYAGSHPSTHTTTTGPRGRAYRRPFTSIMAPSIMGSPSYTLSVFGVRMRHLVVLDLVSDLSIGLACAAIAAVLLHFARRPTGSPYARVLVAFAAFVVFDGATHLVSVWSVWQPSLWMATGLRVATAVASVALALLLPPFVPKALGLGAAEVLLEEAPDAVMLVDGHGAIRLVNQRAERLFGYSRHDLLGRPATIVLPTDVRSAPELQRDVHGVRRDGSRFPAEISVSPLAAAGGQLVTAVVRDVTDRRQLEDDRTERGRAEVARAHAEEISRRASFLAEASRVLSASLDYEATLRSVARVAIPYLADYVLVDVIEAQGRLRRLSAAHTDPAIEERLAAQRPPTPIAATVAGALQGVIARGEPTLVRDVSEEWLAT